MSEEGVCYILCLPSRTDFGGGGEYKLIWEYRNLNHPSTAQLELAC